jgi:DNA invertase Pin-like site-specific DNA recombinase
MMPERAKVTPEHLRRAAVVYVRQSTTLQVERHRESTARQYALVEHAAALGWRRDQISVIDEDLGLSGASAAGRGGFTAMTAQVALGRVGIVLGLEVSRLARNNADWYRLLDICGMTDTLIGDADGLYHPGAFNDRLVLGLKGTMSEAELHIMRARLSGGIRNKAARGELRRALPIGFVWGEGEGEVRFHPDEAVVEAIRSVFARFDEFGSVRRVWLWLRSQGAPFPAQSIHTGEIRWGSPSYAAIHHILTNPVYAGAYVYGKTRQERVMDGEGKPRKRVRKLAREDWAVFLPEHHEGFIDAPTYEANRARIAANTRPRAHKRDGIDHDGAGPPGAIREGSALLQGIASCGHCGRRLRTHYRGRNSSPGYHCAGKDIVEGRGVACLSVGGVQIDRAVGAALLAALEPGAITAALAAAERLEADEKAALGQWRREVERCRYAAGRVERRYRAVDSENRLVARGLEAEWESALKTLGEAEAALACRQGEVRGRLGALDRQGLIALAEDLGRVWAAPSTGDRDRKALLRALLEEVVIAIERDAHRAELALRWQGGLVTRLEVALPRSRPATVRSDEETIALVRRLAVHYPDGVIAGILNKQKRKTARGLDFTANRVGNLRRHWEIPRHEAPKIPPDGELVSVRKAAEALDMAPSTLHRWLAEGFIAGEQLTPGAPWRIRLDADLRDRFVEEAPAGYVTMQEATKRLGISRQAVLQRVKRGELEAVHLRRGRRKGLRINVMDQLPGLFEVTS